MILFRDKKIVEEYFLEKRPSKSADIIYGYSIFNITLNKIIARVYKVFKQSEWIKLDSDTGNILEYYREFRYETADGIISIAYDCNTWNPIEYYKNTNRRGISERIKFDLMTNKELAYDLFLSKENMDKYLPSDICNDIRSLPFDIIYFGKKPYGNVVGFIEEFN